MFGFVKRHWVFENVWVIPCSNPTLCGVNMHRETTTPKCRTTSSTVRRSTGVGLIAALAVSSITACSPAQEPVTPEETTDPNPGNTQTVTDPAPSDTITIPSTPDTPKEEEPPAEAEPEFDIDNVKIGDMVPADKVEEAKKAGHRVYVSVSKDGQGEVFEEGTVPKSVQDDVNAYGSGDNYMGSKVSQIREESTKNGISYVVAGNIPGIGWTVAAYGGDGKVVPLTGSNPAQSKEKAASIARSYAEKVGIPVVIPE